MKKAIPATLFVCLVVGAAQAQEEPKVVVRGGDVVVTDTELENAIETLPDEYRAYAAGEGKKSFAEDLLRMKRLARAAEESGVAQRPSVRAQLAISRANTLASAQVEEMRKSIEVDAERVKEIYDERKDQFERASARHILIAFEGSPAAGEDPPTDGEAKATAENILERIRGGEDFAAIARAESADKGSGARGGELGEFAKGQMVPAFEDAVFSAEAGELTPIVKTQFGYHVIEVRERKTMALEEVREQIESELRQQMLQQQIENLDAETEVVFDETYFGDATPDAPAE